MNSRYDFMVDSVVLDTDGQLWPDPLLNCNTGSLSKLPTEYKITTRDLTRFWTVMWEQYGMNELDDLLLNINGISYVMDLKPGDVIYKVVSEDLTGFFKFKQIGYEE